MAVVLVHYGVKMQISFYKRYLLFPPLLITIVLLIGLILIAFSQELNKHSQDDLLLDREIKLYDLNNAEDRKVVGDVQKWSSRNLTEADLGSLRLAAEEEDKAPVVDPDPPGDLPTVAAGEKVDKQEYFYKDSINIDQDDDTVRIDSIEIKKIINKNAVNFEVRHEKMLKRLQNSLLNREKTKEVPPRVPLNPKITDEEAAAVTKPYNDVLKDDYEKGESTVSLEVRTRRIQGNARSAAERSKTLLCRGFENREMCKILFKHHNDV